MSADGSRRFRQNTQRLLDGIDAGEVISITVDGRTVADFQRSSRRRRWMGKDDFLGRAEPRQADAALSRELRELSPDTAGAAVER